MHKSILGADVENSDKHNVQFWHQSRFLPKKLQPLGIQRQSQFSEMSWTEQSIPSIPSKWCEFSSTRH